MHMHHTKPLALALAVGVLFTSLPALAAAPQAKQPRLPGAVIKLVAPDATWEQAVTTSTAKLKAGMNSDDTVSIFSAETKAKHKQIATFDMQTVEEFLVPKVKKRVYIELAFYRTGPIHTKRMAVLAFESPLGDYTGAHARLVKKVVQVNPLPPHAPLRLGQKVSSISEINKLTRFKFGSKF